MLAVDTNIVVRLLMKDDLNQHGRVLAVFQSTKIWIPVTVVLESEWVMRRAFGIGPVPIATALRSLIGIDGVRIEQPAAVVQALDWLEQGMDFADALHLALASECDGLATFDRDFIKAAARIGAGNVAEP